MEKFEEKIKKEKTEEEIRKEKEENYEKIERIFQMFGTEKAKEKFKNLLDEYHLMLKKVEIKTETEAQSYAKGRGEIHKKIMDTLAALSIHQEAGGEEEKILRSLADKDVAAQAIEDWYGEEFRKKYPKLSEVGKWHKEGDE